FIGETRRTMASHVAAGACSDIHPRIVDATNVPHRAKRGLIRCARRQVEIASDVEQGVGLMRDVIDRRTYNDPAIPDRPRTASSRGVTADIEGSRIDVEC